MTCTEVRTHLPLLLYGDLPLPESAAVEHHLADCAACRAEHVALRQLRHDLDRPSVPMVAVDVGRIYQDAATRQARQLRRWRRAAFVLAGLAAAALVLIFLRVEVRLDAHQVLLTWSPASPQPEPAPVPSPAPPVVKSEPADPVSVEERLALLNELLRALARDVDGRDAQRQLDVYRLRVQLEDLQRRDTLRWAETQHDVTALYQAQFGPSKKEIDP